MVVSHTDYVQNHGLVFEPEIGEFFRSRVGRPLTVFAGGNNAGKSLALKYIKNSIGRSAYMIGASRFYHVYQLQSAVREPNEVDQFESSFQSSLRDLRQNQESNFYDLNRLLIGLSNDRRAELLSLCGRLIQCEVAIRPLDANNDLSPRIVEVDGRNLAVASTGTRLLMTVLGICMDDRFSTILIDEPELGLSPRVQQAVSDFFQDRDERTRHFPHLQMLFLATHSHLFLSRVEVSDNFVVSKADTTVRLTQVPSMSEFHRLQFNLLGNSLESMFFPSAIVIVEGKSDFAFLDRIIRLKFPERKVTVIAGQGDVKRRVHALRELVGGELARSPYQNRLFVVMDSVHQRGLAEELEQLGVLPRNVVIWDRNGIEYLYPADLLAVVFAADPLRARDLSVVGDNVSLNGISITKSALAERIVASVTPDTPLPEELERKLLAPLLAAMN